MSAAIRHLIVLRHAKSDWSQPGQSDFERGLKPRGERAAKRLGRFLRESGQQPDQILSSAAVRARETLRLAARAGDWGAVPRHLDALYETSAKEVLELVRTEASECRRLLVVGHEPTSSSLISLLTGEHPPHFPTAAMACIAFVGEWAQLRPKMGELAWLITPKDLR